jgi:hypothetical protein
VYGLQVLDSTKYVPYRESTFLQHPSVPRSVLWDKETVYLYWPGETQPVRYGTGVNVEMGSTLTDTELQRVLRHFNATRLLHFESIEPHTFAGFERTEVRQGWVWHSSDRLLLAARGLCT